MIDPLATITLFVKSAGELVAELQRRDLTTIDIEFLNLKRKILTEKLEEAKAEMETDVIVKKGAAEQYCISKGIANTSIRTNKLHNIEVDAAGALAKLDREYRNAMAEIDLCERRLKAQRPWWSRLFRGRKRK